MYAQITAQGCSPLRCGNKVPVGAQLSLTVVGLVGTSEERKAERSKLGEVHLQMYLGRAFCVWRKRISCGWYRTEEMEEKEVGTEGWT